MKRAVFTLICTLCASAGIYAQNVNVSDGNGPEFGTKVAFDVNIPSTDFLDLNSGTGFSFGGVYNIPLWKGLYFEPGLSFFYNTMNTDIYTTDANLSDPYSLDGKLENCGFRAPLVAGYRIKLTELYALSVFTGPQFNYGLTLKMKAKNISHNMYGNGYGHFDMQWLIGARFHYIDNWFADMAYGIGIGNICTGDNAKIHYLRRNTFSIGVGYMF